MIISPPGADRDTTTYLFSLCSCY